VLFRSKEKNLRYTIHAQYLSGSINDLNEKIRKESINQILKAIDNAFELGADIVTLHPALEPYGLKLEKRKELELETYKKIASYASKNKVKIGLENEAQTCFWFPDRACKFELLNKTICEIDNKNFGMTLDIGHANVSGEDYIAAIKNYSAKIFHIHAHDNFGKPENNLEHFDRPDPHLSPGEGVINWKKVVDSLKEINYIGYFEIECEPDKMEKAIKYIKSVNK
jgi:sugar phosphate isomerase/epimerase